MSCSVHITVTLHRDHISAQPYRQEPLATAVTISCDSHSVRVIPTHDQPPHNHRQPRPPCHRIHLRRHTNQRRRRHHRSKLLQPTSNRCGRLLSFRPLCDQPR
ncbi:hypothetical protein HanIR_Chr01g0002501 [Helianthus annuus]|nr:hypothetical protein HanIR_Chr01g0002501 [Helianthus annuus]